MGVPKKQAKRMRGNHVVTHVKETRNARGQERRASARINQTGVSVKSTMIHKRRPSRFKAPTNRGSVTASAKVVQEGRAPDKQSPSQ